MSPPKALAAVALTHRSQRLIPISRPPEHHAVVRFLNRVLATEIVCALRYRRHGVIARSLGAVRTAERFLAHADEDMVQADLIAERIVQLGGEPDFAPATLQQRSHLEYVAVATVAEMVQENLAAKHLMINNYSALIDYLRDDDPITRGMIEDILRLEQKHANQLIELLKDAR